MTPSWRSAGPVGRNTPREPTAIKIAEYLTGTIDAVLWRDDRGEDAEAAPCASRSFGLTGGL